MKTKSAADSCGPMTKEHGHYGHFTKAEYLNAGHNWSGSAKPTAKSQQVAVNMDAVGPAKMGKPGRYGGAG